MENNERRAANFIENFVEEDLASGRAQQIHTRFPPEPNGYLHIGHAKALVIDFTIAQKYDGKCNLRFDDTNPTKEDTEYVLGIQRDIRWLGFEWENLYYASDFFERLYRIAESMIKNGVAYVDDQTAEAMRTNRGTLTAPGIDSPYRNRGAEENLDLFRRMRAGEFPDGARVLRAKIDMKSPNVLMRDPTIYRIIRHHHHRTGDAWCIYPMYDFQHPIQDAIEGISHSLCSLEYEIHRPLYDWMVREAGFTDYPPRQIEFARLNITRTIMSKRYLRRLVEDGYVHGWDDPRMPTLAAMRRRGYTPESIRTFVERVGVAKADSTVDGALLEHCVRESLAETAPRAMAVLDPVKVTLSNWPEGVVEAIEMVGLKHLMWRDITQLSDGELQRAMIARTLAQDTPIIILDEPTAFLDLPNKYEILLLLRQLTRQKNKTIIFSTHDLNIAMRLVDKIWLMAANGLQQGAPEDIALQKGYDKLFDDTILSFDYEKANVDMGIISKADIYLESDDDLDFWIKRALLRMGFNINKNKIESIPKIKATKIESELKFELYDMDLYKKFTDIYSLGKYLQKYFK